MTAAAAIVYLDRENDRTATLIADCEQSVRAPDASIVACRTLLDRPRLDETTRGLAHRNLGIAHAELQIWDEALAELDTALAIGPEDPAALQWKGYALLEMGRPGDALPVFEAAVALQPDDQYSQARQVRSLRQLGRVEEAETLLAELQVRFPDEAWIPRDRGLARLARGDHVAAAEDLRAAFVLEPDHARTRRKFFEACRLAEQACPPLLPETRADRPEISCAEATRRAVALRFDPDANPGDLPGDLAELTALGVPGAGWIVASAAYVAAALALESEPTEEMAEQMIVYEQLMRCTEDGFRRSLSAGPSRAREVMSEMERFFGGEVGENLLDLAYLTIR